MKKQIISGFFVALAASVMLISGTAEAATLPPGNPFYFMQDGMRSLRRTFTFTPVSRALLEVRLVHERMADIKKVVDAEKGESVVGDAFAAYGEEAQALRTAAGAIDDDRVLMGVGAILIDHGRFFNELLESDAFGAEASGRDAVAFARESLAGLALGVFGDSRASGFVSRIASLSSRDGNPYAEIRIADALSSLELGIADAGKGSDPLERAIKIAKDDLLIGFIGAVKAGSVSLDKAADLPGDKAVRLYVFEEMRVRAHDADMKSRLAQAEQRLASDSVRSRLATAASVQEAILRARGAQAGLSARSGEEAAYFAEQAGMLLMNNAYDLAFQNAVMAYVSASEASFVAGITESELRAAIVSLKREYDALPGTKPSFVEKRIGAIADMAGSAAPQTTLAAIREMRLILGLLHK